MGKLKEKIAQLVPVWRERYQNLVKNHGDKKISDVTVAQAFGGMRGVKCLVCDTSEVPPDKGLLIRGIPVKELTHFWPEDCLYLLLTGEMPDQEARADVMKELKARAGMPTYVVDVLKALPQDTHPMTMFSMGILAMQRESVFAKRYAEGMGKKDYGDATLEDALNLIAKLPEVAAAVYRIKFHGGNLIPYNPELDWGANYAAMLGIPDPNGEFTKLMRLYLVLHSDHESGNVSAMTTATVNSALSDVYYSLSAGMNGLAGPLHGLANQECLIWIMDTIKKFNGVPTEDQLYKYAQETLEAGRVVPGYGHAVLRVTDPRFEAFLEFGKQYCKGDPIFETVSKVFDVVPNVLKQVQKIKDPWPNVDAGSGALLYHYGLKEMNYYTVLFGVSRALGVLSQAVINRSLGYPITRPKSVTTEWIQKTVEAMG